MTRNGIDSAPLLRDDTDPVAFFHQLVVEAQSRVSVDLSENVEFYLVHLLSDFVYSDPTVGDEALALVLARALESSYGEQVLLFKKLGDTALFFSGFFQEFFNSKSYDISYYQSMGENAYGFLADLMRRRGTYEKTMSRMYRELAKGFPQAVEVLLDVSEHTSGPRRDARNTLSIYEAWLATASETLERELHQRGIVPVKVRGKMQ